MSNSPRVIVDEQRGFALFDQLLSLWAAKSFPYNRPGALIPQTLIPDSIRHHENPETIYCFYFYACLYMRGGIESAQAFRALINLYTDHQDLFDPHHAQQLTVAELRPILKEYIGWDAANVAKFWILNSKRLVRNWDGKVSNICKDLTSWDEAQRRIWNGDHWPKRNVFGKASTRGKHQGFVGFRPKMVAMLVYFLDWEGLLETRFVYPTPADFHNFRIGLGQRVLRLVPEPISLRNHELISAPWRDLTMKYLEGREADPVALADAIWLFSLEACGNSPITTRRSPDHTAASAGGLDLDGGLRDPHTRLLQRRHLMRILNTCGQCPIRATCELAIPAGPYYQRRGERPEAYGGHLYLNPRFRFEEHVPQVVLDRPPVSVTKSKSPEQVILL
jgi:hypothetical protein